MMQSYEVFDASNEELQAELSVIKHALRGDASAGERGRCVLFNHNSFRHSVM